MFKSSVEVMVSVFAEQVMSNDAKDTKFVMDAFVTMVSVDDNGTAQPMQVMLTATTDAEQQRMAVSAGASYTKVSHACAANKFSLLMICIR